MTKNLDDTLDDVERWNREDASELEHPSGPDHYGIVVAARDWTVETIVQQIQRGNVELEPAFQRRNAWRDHRRSRLIESFVLGFPVPQIVLAENPRRKKSYIVIDGKQRLLTIAGFFLAEYRQYWTSPRLSGLKALKPLNHVTIEDFLTDPQFEQELRQLGNADIRTTVISGFTDENVLYDIFYRINTGAVPLSTQELRQVLNRGPFAKYLLELTSESNPLWAVLQIDSPDPRLRDVELLLRLIAWRLFSSAYKGNMKPFLDAAMVRLNESWDTEQDGVRRVVADILAGVEMVTTIYGANAGRKFKNGKYERALNRALFEVEVYSFSFRNVRNGAKTHRKAIVDRSKKLGEDNDFIESIESTTKSIDNYRTRYRKYGDMLREVLAISPPTLALEKQTKNKRNKSS
jgi:hypothetical protein